MTFPGENGRNPGIPPAQSEAGKLVPQRETRSNTPEDRLIQSIKGKLSGGGFRFAKYSGVADNYIGFTTQTNSQQDFFAYIEGIVAVSRPGRATGEGSARVLVRWFDINKGHMGVLYKTI